MQWALGLKAAQVCHASCKPTKRTFKPVLPGHRWSSWHAQSHRRYVLSFSVTLGHFWYGYEDHIGRNSLRAPTSDPAHGHRPCSCCLKSAIYRDGIFGQRAKPRRICCIPDKAACANHTHGSYSMPQSQSFSPSLAFACGCSENIAYTKLFFVHFPVRMQLLK